MTEQVPLKHQFLPLAPLSTIDELPKQEPRGGSLIPNSPASNWDLAGAEKVPSPDLDTVREPKTSDSMDREEVGISEPLRGLPSSPPIEAVSIPLPQSPALDASPNSAELRPSAVSMHGTKSAQELGPGPDEPTPETVEQTGGPDGGEKSSWASTLTAMLPQTILDRSSRQDTGMANSQVSRKASVAPGAYPESDSIEETPIPSPGSNLDQPHMEAAHSESVPPRSDGKSMRPRKSVSIALPNTDKESKNAERTGADGSIMLEDDHITDQAASNLRKDANDRKDPNRYPEEDVAGNDKSQEVKQDTRDKEDASIERQSEVDPVLKASAAQPDQELLLKPSHDSNHRNITPTIRANSIAASQEDIEQGNSSTLHERESLAPSDADNSSLKPLLSSSPRDAGSSHFSESLDHIHREPTSNGRGKAVEVNNKSNADSPPIIDDLSSLSTISSINGSEPEEAHKKRKSEYPFPPVDNGEGPSHAQSSLPAPKIAVMDASSAEDSMHSPPPRAPTTTPVQDGLSPRRQTTFVALGEPSQGPVKLPMKRRKLYLRKARCHVLRQPILNAALGRQMGTQAKIALKKLANGELIIIEPPASL